MAKRSDSDILAALEKQKAQIDARIQKKKAKLRGQERKDDTRRKIIVGALALEHARHDENFRATIERLVDQNVERKQDRALFNL